MGVEDEEGWIAWVRGGEEREKRTETGRRGEGNLISDSAAHCRRLTMNFIALVAQHIHPSKKGSRKNKEKREAGLVWQ